MITEFKLGRELPTSSSNSQFGIVKNAGDCQFGLKAVDVIHLPRNRLLRLNVPRRLNFRPVSKLMQIAYCDLNCVGCAPVLRHRIVHKGYLKLDSVEMDI